MSFPQEEAAPQARRAGEKDLFSGLNAPEYLGEPSFGLGDIDDVHGRERSTGRVGAGPANPLASPQDQRSSSLVAGRRVEREAARSAITPPP